MIKKLFWPVFLAVVCAGTLSLTLPTIKNNIDDPNLIVYFSGDEGMLMDLAWYYYSGEKRATLFSNIDYGIEMIYLADFSRIFLSKFIEIQPGTLVLILRWLHLLSWLGAIIALWWFVGYHFGKGWHQVFAVLLLASRPALDYFLMSLKPEPLVLLLMIIGLHYVLKIIDKPTWRNVCLAVLFASLSFLIKFAGAFLIIAIVSSIFLARRVPGNDGRSGIFRQRKLSWIFEIVTGAILISSPFFYVFFYKRFSTGNTYFEDFGIIKSIMMNGPALIVIAFGAVLIAVSALMIYSTLKQATLSRNGIIKFANEVNSYLAPVSGLFFLFISVIGARWLSEIQGFIATYSLNLFDFMGVFNLKRASEGNVFSVYLNYIWERVISYDLLFFVLMLLYLYMEVRFYRQNISEDGKKTRKRIVLAVYLLPFFISIASIGRLTAYHTLPFFIAIIVLSLQGISILLGRLKRKPVLINVVFAVFIVLLTSDIFVNASELAKERIYKFNLKGDIVFDFMRWWKSNIPKGSSVISDHFTRVYVTEGWTNTRIFRGDRPGREEELRGMVEANPPDYICMNEGKCGYEPMPPIEKILPERKLKLLKEFHNDADRKFVRHKDDRIVIYKLEK